MALQDGGTLSKQIRDVCVFFASFFSKKEDEIILGVKNLLPK